MYSQGFILEKRKSVYQLIRRVHDHEARSSSAFGASPTTASVSAAAHVDFVQLPILRLG